MSMPENFLRQIARQAKAVVMMNSLSGPRANSQ